MGRSVVFAENEYYHVYNRGVEKRQLFIDEKDHERMVKLLYTANSTTPVHLSNYQGVSLLEIPRGETIVDIGAWCLMPNHFHILVKEKKDAGISLFMRKLLTGYSMYFNTKYERKGTLFERPFKVKHLDDDRYLKYQYAYIHLNPIGIIDSGWKEKKIADKARALAFLNSYQFSSYKDYQNVKRDENAILNKEAFPEYFENETDFDAMIHEWISPIKV